MLLYGCDEPAQQATVWKGGGTCGGSSHILYAWARNAPSLTLPENVGFAIGNPDDSVQWVSYLKLNLLSNSRDFR